MNKKDIRLKYKLKRESLSPEVSQKLNEAIGNIFFKKFNFKGINVLHTFLPIAGKAEVNTPQIVEMIKKENSSIKIAIPKMKDGLLESYLIDDQTKLEVNEWGIVEPINGKRIENKEIDLVITPLLAFDKKGNRVGYGKGFYDKFFNTCRKDAIKVGVSFFEAEEDEIETNEFDVPLNFCVTPSRLYAF